MPVVACEDATTGMLLYRRELTCALLLVLACEETRGTWPMQGASPFCASVHLLDTARSITAACRRVNVSRASIIAVAPPVQCLYIGVRVSIGSAL